jgi:hypothetical protein
MIFWGPFYYFIIFKYEWLKSGGVYPNCAIFSGIRSLFGRNLVLREINCIHADLMPFAWYVLNFHWLIPKCWHIDRVANLGDFPANLRFLGFGENQRIYRGIFKVNYKRAFLVKYYKNMTCSFNPIFQVNYQLDSEVIIGIFCHIAKQLLLYSLWCPSFSFSSVPSFLFFP